jgi:hypothetical protein
MSAAEWQALLQATPDTPENQPLIAAMQNYASQAAVFKLPYWYNIVFLAVPTATPATGFFTVDASAPFLITHSMMHSDVGGVAVTISTMNWPNATIQLVDTGSNRQLMDIATPLGNIFGTSQFPYYWAEPKLMAANSQMQATITSQEAANTPNIRLTFGGYRLYSAAPQ